MQPAAGSPHSLKMSTASIPPGAGGGEEGGEREEEKNQANGSGRKSTPRPLQPPIQGAHTPLHAQEPGVWNRGGKKEGEESIFLLCPNPHHPLQSPRPPLPTPLPTGACARSKRPSRVPTHHSTLRSLVCGTLEWGKQGRGKGEGETFFRTLQL